MKRIALFVLGLALAPVAQADGGSYVTVLGDYLVKPSKNHVPELENGYGLDGRYGGVVDERWNYEVGVFYGALKPKTSGSGDGFHSGVGVDVLFKFGELWTMTPFLIGGGGLAYSDLATGTLIDPRAGLMLDLGAGAYSQPFAHIFGMPLSWRAQAKGVYEHYDKGYVDVRVYAGLQMALSEPPPPAEVAVVPPVEPAPAPAPVVETPPPAPAVAEAVPEQDQGPTIETAKAGDTIVLHGVNFETAKANLTTNAKTILDGVAEQLLKRPELTLEIGGHTDSVGKDAYNQNLSERRAQAVLDYLVSKGIDASHLTSVGYGEGHPIDTNDTDEGREHNRRVELKITGSGTEGSPS